jgi:hypothetical protein
VQHGRGCNVDVVQLIPHCNGTHTESRYHIVDRPERIPPVTPTVLMPALLLSVAAQGAVNCGETYEPPLSPSDHVITVAELTRAWQSIVATWGNWAAPAMIVRTRPNSPAKQTTHYAAPALPPFFTNEAVDWLASHCVHLLVDLPSIDRTHDDGVLSNHHRFWRIAAGSSVAAATAAHDKTITEMIFVDDALTDGMYLLNLQVPAWETDAVPSRPVLFAIVPVAEALGD